MKEFDLATFVTAFLIQTMIQSEYNELGNQRIFINWTKYHSFISQFAVLNSDSDNDSIRVQRIRKSTNFYQLDKVPFVYFSIRCTPQFAVLHSDSCNFLIVVTN